MTLEIPLVNGGKTIIDDVDADFKIYRWRSLDGYASTYHKNKRCVYLHRLIYKRILGRDLTKKEEIDHINKDRLDNRRENLRIATSSQNKVNSALHKNNTSGYVGVSHDRRHKKQWRAYIRINGKHVGLGYFYTPEEAARKRDEVAKQIYGEFARLNNV